ncbi:hypothetical protein NQZ68_014510 [Dissostichus eleginoides]|nr:hypothetical protein NQZ68_014510 [Dissostichus eleginoides]
MTQDELVLVASNTFNSEWIETSKKTLFELCPETKQRCVTFKGNQKDANNIKSCLKKLNECGENIPRFVSHYLDELPPVTFNNLDVSNLLSKMERLHSELEPSHGGGLAVPSDAETACGSAQGDGQDGAVSVKDASPPGSSADVHPNCVDPVAASGTVSVCVSPGGTAVNSQIWTQVVKQGRGRRNKAEGQSALSKQLVGKPERRMPKPIVGTAAQGNIKVVRTKLVSVFATKFSPDLDAETLSEYL